MSVCEYLNGNALCAVEQKARDEAALLAIE